MEITDMELDKTTRHTFGELVVSCIPLIIERSLELSKFLFQTKNVKTVQSKTVASYNQYLKCLYPIETELFETIFLIAQWLKSVYVTKNSIVLDILVSWMSRAP